MMTKKEILSHFGIDVDDADVAPLGTGLINDTFIVHAAERHGCDYVLQRINHNIFRNIDVLQSNIEAVTNHIRRKMADMGHPDIERCTLRFVGNKTDGTTYFFDGNNYWRVMVYLRDTCTRANVTEENAYHCGKAFGNFQQMLSDLDESLEETIPDFHNMEFRLEQFDEAVREDRAGRKSEVAALIGELESRRDHACLAERLHREGWLPKRVCHCDTKIDNMLFDKEGRVVCVIDLDTVMPSFIFSDFGDFLRTAANTGKEDDKNLDNVDFNMPIFRAFAKGYIEGASSFLTSAEIDNLPYAAERFAYMQAVRFLTDYLNGDTYYKTAYPEHNLVRARAQFRLLERIESKLPEMSAYIESLVQAS